MISLIIRYCKFTAESDIEIILNIDQHLAKLSARVQCLVFLLSGYDVFWHQNNDERCGMLRKYEKSAACDVDTMSAIYPAWLE